MIILRRLAAMSLALAIATLGAPGRASAAESATLAKSQYLTSAPVEALPNSCQSRSIFLATGDYAWQNDSPDRQGNVRRIFLATGTYVWESCLDPRNGLYDHHTTLKKPGSPMAHLDLFDITVFRSGDQTWGSTLSPLF